MAMLVVVLVALLGCSTVADSNFQDPSQRPCIDKVVCPDPGNEFLQYCLKNVANTTDPVVSSLFSAAGLDGVNLRQTNSAYCQADAESRVQILGSFTNLLGQKKNSCKRVNNCDSYNERQRNSLIFEIYKDCGDLYHIPGLFNCDYDYVQFRDVLCSQDSDTQVSILSYVVRSINAQIPGQCLEDSSGCGNFPYDQVLGMAFDTIKNEADKLSIPGLYNCQHDLAVHAKNLCATDKQAAVEFLQRFADAALNNVADFCTKTPDCEGASELKDCMSRSYRTTKRFGICDAQ